MARKPELYCRIAKSTWGDAKFRQLSKPDPSGQWLWIWLLSGPHQMSLPGLFPMNHHVIAGALGWTLDESAVYLAEITDMGLAQHDLGAGVLYLSNAIDYNRPQSPSNVSGWRRHFDQVPESPLRWRWLGKLSEHCDGRRQEIVAANAVETDKSKHKNPDIWRPVPGFGDLKQPEGGAEGNPEGGAEPPAMDRERYRDLERKEREESCRAETSATSQVGDNQSGEALIPDLVTGPPQTNGAASLTTAAHDLTVARAAKRAAQGEMLKDWSNDLIKFVPEHFQAYLPYLLAEFADLVDENRGRKNETFTVTRKANFARRMSKCNPLDQMLAIEIFVDRAPTADERYPAKIAETMKHYTDDEIGGERDRHRSKHPAGVWAQWKRNARERAGGKP